MLENCVGLISCEDRLRPKLEHISLLGQIALSDDDVEKLINFISEKIRERGLAEAIEFFREKAPLCFCCSLVWLGIRGYRGGDYWSFVREKFKIALKSTGWQTQWGDIFREFLRKKRLPAFEDIGSRINVDAILAHGGIPDYCLTDYFKNLVEPIALEYLETGIDFQQIEGILEDWKSGDRSFQSIDVPVEYFLQHGGRVVADLLTRCVELAQQTYAEGRVPEDQTEIPLRIVQSFQKWWELRDDRPSLRHQLQPRLQRPVIHLSIESNEICLRIPQQRLSEQHLEISIVFNSNQGEITRKTLPTFKKGNLSETEEAILPIPYPAERYEAKLLAQDGTLLRSWCFTAISKEKAWLAFDNEKLELIQAEAIPQSLFWLICPSNLLIMPSHSKREEGRLFGKWSSYALYLIDARALEKMRLQDEKEQIGPFILHTAQEISPRMEFVAGELARYCTSEHAPVYRTAPKLLIPATEQPSRWRLCTIRLDGNTNLDRKEYNWVNLTNIPRQDKQDKVEFALSDLFSRENAIGRFRLEVRGPLGQSYRFRFALVPADLSIEWDQPLYAPGFDQSNPILKLSSDFLKDIHVANYLAEKQGRFWSIRVLATESLLECTLYFQDTKEEINFPLTIQVPRLRLALQELEKQASLHWSLHTLCLLQQNWENSQNLFLKVNVPTIEQGQITLQLEETGQRVNQRILRGGVCFELKHFSDTLRNLRKSVSRFFLDLHVESIKQHILVLEIHSGWPINNLRYTQTVKDGRRVLHLFWKDVNPLQNRAVRLWTRDYPQIPLLSQDITTANPEVRIERSCDALWPGKYLLEFAVVDEWSSSVPNPPVEPDGISAFYFDVGSEEEQRNFARLHLQKFLDQYREYLRRQRSWYSIGDHKSLLNFEKLAASGQKPETAILRQGASNRLSTKDIVLPRLVIDSLDFSMKNDDEKRKEIGLGCKTRSGFNELTQCVLICQFSGKEWNFEIHTEQELYICSRCDLVIPADLFWQEHHCAGIAPQFTIFKANTNHPVALAVLWDSDILLKEMKATLFKAASNELALPRPNWLEALQMDYDNSIAKPNWRGWVNGLVTTVEELWKFPNPGEYDQLELGWKVAYYRSALEVLIDTFFRREMYDEP